jgi:hypothetical protein
MPNDEIDEEERRNQQINEYLDMNKDEYVNKEEYHNIEGMNSYEDHQADGEINSPYDFEEKNRNVTETPEQLEEEGEYYEQEEVRHAGLQTVFLEEESKHMLHYILEGEGNQEEVVVVEVDQESILNPGYPEYGNSPIQENDDEQYSTPNQEQEYEDNLIQERMHLFQIANEVKKKDQSRKFVLWETNELRNQWDDKQYPNFKRVISQK